MPGLLQILDLNLTNFYLFLSQLSQVQGQNGMCDFIIELKNYKSLVYHS